MRASSCQLAGGGAVVLVVAVLVVAVLVVLADVVHADVMLADVVLAGVVRAAGRASGSWPSPLSGERIGRRSPGERR